jgi:hypothetical protein
LLKSNCDHPVLQPSFTLRFGTSRTFQSSSVTCFPTSSVGEPQSPHPVTSTRCCSLVLFILATHRCIVVLAFRFSGETAYKEERFIWFTVVRCQSMVGWFHCFWAFGGMGHHDGRLCGGDRSPYDSPERKRQQGARSQHPLQGCPNDLTSSHEASPPTGPTTCL